MTEWDSIVFEAVVKLKVTQMWLTLCDPMDYTAHWILQARILEWVDFSFSRESSKSRDQTQVSCIAGGFFTSWATREALALTIWTFVGKVMSLVFFFFFRTDFIWVTDWRSLVCNQHEIHSMLLYSHLKKYISMYRNLQIDINIHFFEVQISLSRWRKKIRAIQARQPLQSNLNTNDVGYLCFLICCLGLS